MYLYYTNYVYNILVKLNRDTPLYKWYVTPIDASEDDTKTDAFKKESKKVDQIIKKFKPSLTLRTVTTQVSLEGKSSYLPRISYDKDTVNFFVLQKLNPDMVKLTSFGSKQQFGASFNMVIFLQPAYDVSQYPKFIQDAWEEMLATGVVTMDKKGKVKFNPRAKLPAGHILENKNGNYMYWVPLPQDLCYTFYFDGSHANMFPDFLGLFDDLSDLDNYKWLQASLLSKGVNSILTAEIPLVKDAKAG
uniref:Portal protein n=1 Tax=Siphoviridae sp. ct5op20 TaxID=2826295 RepID=A0A8S5NRA5_9CAUD|nr:MAG TPA: Portal protein [Siphoviridae sp. ct5op20]